jgi:hypothetical protein
MTLAKYVYNMVHLKMIALRDVAPCFLVEADRRFRGAYCVQQGVITEAVRTSERPTSMRLHGATSNMVHSFTSAKRIQNAKVQERKHVETAFRYLWGGGGHSDMIVP